MTNPLETRRGRLVTFFFLYVTEGIPLGFTATAIVAQMRRQGLGPAVTGAFVASLYLPWSWKWIAGPVVDVCSSDRFGRRRGWIVACQLLMVATLLAGLAVDFTTQVAIFTAIILMHNFFGAVQDVAIDALACETLPAEERGIANGLMFAGAYLGNALGGSGVLFLQAYLGDFRFTFPIVGAAIFLVTVTISLRLKERKRSRDQTNKAGSRWKRVAGDLRQYIVSVRRQLVFHFSDN